MGNGGRAGAFRRAAPERPPHPPGFSPGFDGIPASSNDNWLDDPEPGPAIELDCLRHILAPALLKAAEARGQEVATGADQVLIRSGVIGEEAYLRALSFQSGLAIETFAEVSRSDCPLPDRYLSSAAQHGLLPLRLRWTRLVRQFGGLAKVDRVRFYAANCSVISAIAWTSSGVLPAKVECGRRRL
ncbi:hypothetical protein [Nitrobacter sp. TKz-YC01]|uniref:hypothetical protein n=1 Tax=Nitrobacter sp. TKz-YC01 TaxID=3398703 RepID=UPI003A103526